MLGEKWKVSILGGGPYVMGDGYNSICLMVALSNICIEALSAVLLLPMHRSGVWWGNKMEASQVRTE